MKKEQPNKLAQMEKQRNEARAVSKASTPKADPKAGKRPAGVSQYVWDRVASGTLSGLNTTSITRDPEMREALIKAGHEDYVKAAYEKSMDQRAAHYGQNGADDPWATAQESWYNNKYGQYKNDTVGSSNTGLSFGGSTGDPTNEGYVAPEAPPPVEEATGGGGGFFNGIRNGTATNIKGGGSAGGTDASTTVDQTGGNPSGMFNNLMDAVGGVRDPNNQEPIKFTQQEIDKELEDRAAAQAAEDAAAQAAADQAQADLFNPTQSEEVVRNRNFQTVDYGTQEGPTAGVNTGIGVAGPSQSTPWADAYMRTQSLGGGQPIAGLPSGVKSNDNFPPTTGGVRPSGPTILGGPTVAGPVGGIPHLTQAPVGGGTVQHGGVRPMPPGVQPRPLPPGHGGFKPNDDRGYGPQPGGGYIPDDTGFFNTEKTTPWADAFLRAEKAATKQGPISGLFSKEMENS
jgi:hypothetical protein